MSSNSLAMHSSAKELETTFTPVKSRAMREFSVNNGRRCSRILAPISRVPKSVAMSVNLNSLVELPLVHSVSSSSVSTKYSLNCSPHQCDDQPPHLD